MAYPDEGVVQTWLDALKGLDVRVKKMFGCYCVYCDDQPVGWISQGVFSLREVGLPRETGSRRFRFLWTIAIVSGCPGRCRRPPRPGKRHRSEIARYKTGCKMGPDMVQSVYGIGALILWEMPAIHR